MALRKARGPGKKGTAKDWVQRRFSAGRQLGFFTSAHKIREMLDLAGKLTPSARKRYRDSKGRQRDYRLFSDTVGERKVVVVELMALKADLKKSAQIFDFNSGELIGWAARGDISDATKWRAWRGKHLK